MGRTDPPRAGEKRWPWSQLTRDDGKLETNVTPKAFPECAMISLNIILSPRAGRQTALRPPSDAHKLDDFQAIYFQRPLISAQEPWSPNHPPASRQLQTFTPVREIPSRRDLLHTTPYGKRRRGPSF